MEILSEEEGFVLKRVRADGSEVRFAICDLVCPPPGLRAFSVRQALFRHVIKVLGAGSVRNLDVTVEPPDMVYRKKERSLKE